MVLHMSQPLCCHCTMPWHLNTKVYLHRMVHSAMYRRIVDATGGFTRYSAGAVNILDTSLCYCKLENWKCFTSDRLYDGLCCACASLASYQLRKP